MNVRTESLQNGMTPTRAATVVTTNRHVVIMTVVHTLAASYVSLSAAQAASAATAASERKSAKYSSLLSSHIFCPVMAIETLGPLADEAQHFLTEIGRRATRCTADPREAAFL